MDCAPRWSVDFLNPTFSLAIPLWSSDGKYISFLQSHAEGSTIGSIDTRSGNYVALNLFGDPFTFQWSPVGHSYAKASAGEYSLEPGLYLSTQDRIGEVVNLAPKLGKDENTRFGEVRFSPDGRKIVFTFEEEGVKRLAIANIDGTGLLVLIEKADIVMPFFSPEGGAVWFFQRKNGMWVLVRYDLMKRDFSDILILPREFDEIDKAFWTKDGFLALVGTSSQSDLSLRRRMVILDIVKRIVVYASPFFGPFTNFVGLSSS
jgi:Tol biopolymer transport system component